MTLSPEDNRYLVGVLRQIVLEYQHAANIISKQQPTATCIEEFRKRAEKIRYLSRKLEKETV